MSLPPNCQEVTLEERTITSKAFRSQEVSQPCFAIYDKSFRAILGDAPEIDVVLERDYPFAHEAPVYVPDQDAVYFTSSPFTPRGATEQMIQINKAVHHDGGSWICEPIDTDVVMGNGGFNHGNGIVLCAQGDHANPGGVVHMDIEPPYKSRPLIDGYHGRPFTSVNDLVVHQDGSIWFTDPIYGYEQGFRPKPQLPCQVYRFEQDSGDIRVVADGFGRPNGLAFSPDGETMYITDTDMVHGDGTIEATRVGTIYAFDVIERAGGQFLANKRVFAMADAGIPDGIKCDTEGNVYAGCFDGVEVWNAAGRLLGKILVPGGVANFCFTRPGELFMCNEKRVVVAHFSPKTQGALLFNLGHRDLQARTR